MDKIEELQKERGSEYGKYEINASYVGSKILDFIHHYKKQNNGDEPDIAKLGSLCHIWIKEARLLHEPVNEDTLLDYESYVNLHRKYIEYKDPF